MNPERNPNKRPGSSGNDSSPPKRVAGGLALPPNPRRSDDPLLHMRQSLQGGLQAQPHVGSSDKGKQRAQIAATSTPSTQAPSGAPRSRSGTPPDQLAEEGMPEEGMYSPSMEKFGYALSPGGEHLISTNSNTYFGEVQQTQTRLDLPQPASTLPEFDWRRPISKITDVKPIDEFAMMCYVGLGRNVIQPPLNHLPRRNAKDRDAADSICERRSEVARQYRKETSAWELVWGDHMEQGAMFKPLTVILERLPIGSMHIQKLYADPTFNLLAFHRKVCGLHGPGPNYRFQFTAAQIGMGIDSVEATDPRNIALDMTCNPLDGVIVLLRNVAPKPKADAATSFGGYPSVEKLRTPVGTAIRDAWCNIFEVVPGQWGPESKNPGPWLWEGKWIKYKYTLPIGRFATNKKSFRHLNYMIIASINDAPSVAVILRCLKSRESGTGEIPDWKHRETFQIGHWAFYALLSLPRSQDLAWSLVAMNEFEVKRVQSITVFRPTQVDHGSSSNKGYYDMTDWPALLFNLQDKPMQKVMHDLVPELVQKYYTKESGYVDPLPNIRCDPISETFSVH